MVDFPDNILVDSYRFLIRIEDEEGKSKLTIEELAPLVDAGLTPYRAIKKIRHMLAPVKSIAVMGIGGLGYYAVQYAKILGQTSNIIASTDKMKDFSCRNRWRRFHY